MEPKFKINQQLSHFPNVEPGLVKVVSTTYLSMSNAEGGTVSGWVYLVQYADGHHDFVPEHSLRNY